MKPPAKASWQKSGRLKKATENVVEMIITIRRQCESVVTHEVARAKFAQHLDDDAERQICPLFEHPLLHAVHQAQRIHHELQRPCVGIDRVDAGGGFGCLLKVKTRLLGLCRA